MIHHTAKVREASNRNLGAWNMLVQLLTPNTDPESHNAQRFTRTDGQHHDANSQSY